MKPQQNNFAYIDGANLHRGIAYLSDQKSILQTQKEKAPIKDEP